MNTPAKAASSLASANTSATPSTPDEAVVPATRWVDAAPAKPTGAASPAPHPESDENATVVTAAAPPPETAKPASRRKV
ncbi:MAG: hypothetical protein ACTS8S_04480 [Giesbergeria sp.]